MFFRQKRFGFNNELIEVFKFRSMYTDMTDASASKLVTKGDPRVTRVGRIIRKTSLDELPQLFNVMIGNLSLVGPRPHALQAKADNRLYHDVVDGYFARHKVKPGITGWAQINGWRGETIRPRRSRSAWSATSIISRTGRCCWTSTSFSARRSRCCRPKTRTEPARTRRTMAMAATGLEHPAQVWGVRRSFVHRASLFFVWLAITSGFVVVTEPAPWDALTMGLLILLPVVGLISIRPLLTLMLLLMMIAGAGALVGVTIAKDQTPAAIHTGVSIFLYIAAFLYAAFVARRPSVHARIILKGSLAGA